MSKVGVVMFQQRIIKLIGQLQRDTAIAMVTNLPLNANIELVARETPKVRGLDANGLMWAGTLKDIASQAWLNNRQFTAEIWHYFFKTEYLPEDDEPYLFELVTKPENYKKWDYNPKGERVLVGSTTELTKYGFSQYLEQVHAFGANLGVMFYVK
jgi:hypothetical protein